jgi:hypothetical protein
VGVGTCYAVKTVEKDTERRCVNEERFDQGEIEDGFEEDNIVCHGVDDGYFRRAIGEVSHFGQIDLPK